MPCTDRLETSPPRRSAFAQLRERDYAAKYRGRGEPVHLIGVEFSRKTRNVTAFVGAGLRAFSQLGSFGFFRLDDLDPVLPQLLSSAAVDRRRGQNDARRAASSSAARGSSRIPAARSDRDLREWEASAVYSSICGYTEGDLGTVFAPDLDGMDRERVRVREWYNGL